jgi:hypothetical protein
MPAADLKSRRMARPEGLEPPTLCFEGRCSIQLSYRRVLLILPEVRALERAQSFHSYRSATMGSTRMARRAGM